MTIPKKVLVKNNIISYKYNQTLEISKMINLLIKFRTDTIDHF